MYHKLDLSEVLFCKVSANCCSWEGVTNNAPLCCSPKAGFECVIIRKVWLGCDLHPLQSFLGSTPNPTSKGCLIEGHYPVSVLWDDCIACIYIGIPPEQNSAWWDSWTLKGSNSSPLIVVYPTSTTSNWVAHPVWGALADLMSVAHRLPA